MATLAVAAVLALALSACQEEPEPVRTGTESVRPSASAAPTAPDLPPGMRLVLDVDFDDLGAGAGVALAEGTPVTGAPGGPAGAIRLGGVAPVEPTVAAGAEGTGLRLAVPCDPHEECPKAVVEFADSADLVPGTRDFLFGISLLMQADETSKGSNVFQKGFNNGGASQWKLQVDGEKGHASCVLVGSDPADDYLVTGTATVADGSWHVVECRREGATLSLLVDGVVDKSRSINPATDVSPPSPLRVGGKSLKPDNDQYFGVMDDLYYAVSDS